MKKETFEFKNNLTEEAVKSLVWVSAKGIFCHLVKDCYGKDCSGCNRKIKQLLEERW